MWNDPATCLTPALDGAGGPAVVGLSVDGEGHCHDGASIPERRADAEIEIEWVGLRYGRGCAGRRVAVINTHRDVDLALGDLPNSPPR